MMLCNIKCRSSQLDISIKSASHGFTNSCAIINVENKLPICSWMSQQVILISRSYTTFPSCDGNYYYSTVFHFVAKKKSFRIDRNDKFWFLKKDLSCSCQYVHWKQPLSNVTTLQERGQNRQSVLYLLMLNCLMKLSTRRGLGLGCDCTFCLLLYLSQHSHDSTGSLYSQYGQEKWL